MLPNFAEMFWSKLQKVSDLLPVLRSDLGSMRQPYLTAQSHVFLQSTLLNTEFLSRVGGIGEMQVDGWPVHDQHEERIIPNALFRAALALSFLSYISTFSQESTDPSGSRILNFTVCASRTACGSGRKEPFSPHIRPQALKQGLKQLEFDIYFK